MDKNIQLENVSNRIHSQRRALIVSCQDREQSTSELHFNFLKVTKKYGEKPQDLYKTPLPFDHVAHSESTPSLSRIRTKRSMWVHQFATPNPLRTP